MTAPTSGIPDVAIWNLGSSYINGLRMTYVDITHFTVAQGQARDSTNQNDIVLTLPPLNNGTPVTTAFTLNIGANGAGGLDQGTIAASTLYYVFAIASSQDSWINIPPSPIVSQTVPPFTSPSPTTPVTQDGYYVQANVMISLSMTNPVLPYGFDMFRRIGCVRINSASHVEPFTQTGYGQNRTMRYQTPVAPGTAATAGTTSYATIGALLNIVPQTPVDVIVDASLAPATAGDSLYLAPYGNTAAPGGYETRMSAAVIQPAAQFTQLVCPGVFNAAGTPVIEVDYATTAGAGTTVVTFLINGYVDAL